MQIPIFQADAFAYSTFHGNPAAVCVLDDWLDDSLMQAIARENNLSETAFIVGGYDQYNLRWFTPDKEVDLCGHATLVSGYVALKIADNSLDKITFSTKSGDLIIRTVSNLLSLDLPTKSGDNCDIPYGLEEALGAKIIDIVSSIDLLIRVENEEVVRTLKPDLDFIASEINYRGIVVTAKGKNCDFVSRYFGPAVGIPEDPVTGSAHCVLTPYWSKILGKENMVAHQLSDRGGIIICDLRGDIVRLTGAVAPYMRGMLEFSPYASVNHQ